MAAFLENFRTISGPQSFSKNNPIMENRWGQANWSGFEKGIEEGSVKGTDKYYENERNTVRAMDNLYADLSLKFQDYLNGKQQGLSNDEILEESIAFVESQAENGPLKDMKFDNGKSFYENFRQYGYNKNLLPSSNDKVSWIYRDGETRKVPELRYDKVFSFRAEPYIPHERLGDKRVPKEKTI